MGGERWREGDGEFWPPQPGPHVAPQSARSRPPSRCGNGSLTVSRARGWVGGGRGRRLAPGGRRGLAGLGVGRRKRAAPHANGPDFVARARALARTRLTDLLHT